MKKFFTLLAALAAAAPAVAQQPAETFTASVQQSDLNLASPAGVATFKGRVKALADRTCGAVPVAPLREADPIAECRARLFRSADAQLAAALGSADTRGTN